MKIKEIYETMSYGPAPESADEAIQFLESHNRSFKLFINGKWTAPASGEYFESTNPCTKETLAKISEANEADVNKAVAAAKKPYQNGLILAHIKEQDIYMHWQDKYKNIRDCLQF